MAADVASTLAAWSTTAASNAPSGSTAISTNLDDNLREIQKVVRYLAANSTIASAATTDLSTIPETYVSITGTTTITAFGTVSAGIYKWCVFAGALTLTHNGTSLILPTSANITTAANDVALMWSLGAGNWRCLHYMRASGATIIGASTFSDGTVGAPGIAFTLDTNTGIYRSGGDTLNITAGGVSCGSFGNIGAASTVTLNPTGTASVSPAGNLTLTSTGTGTTVTVSTANAVAPDASGNITIQPGQNGNLTPGGNIYIRSGVPGVDAPSDIIIEPNWTATITATRPKARIGKQNFIDIDSHGQVIYRAAASPPIISSGAGATGTIVGTDSAFQVTCGGAGISDTIVVNFGIARLAGVVVMAIAQNQTTHMDVKATSTTSAVTIVGSSTFNSGDKIAVIVAGIV